jgi:hypothetical protein
MIRILRSSGLLTAAAAIAVTSVIPAMAADLTDVVNVGKPAGY